MNMQNVPPGQSGADDRDDRYEPDDSRQGPYGSRVRDEPDLDAGAPVLRSSDVQKLNRKALVFLAGIVLLIIAAILWTIGAFSKDDDVKPAPKVTEVAIPDAPMPRLPPSEPVQPIAVEPQPPMPMLPPDPEMMGNPSQPSGVAPVPQGPSLMDRRMMNGMENAGGDPTAGQSGPVDPNAPFVAEMSKATSAEYIRNPDVLLVRGTFIRCVLETRIITDIPGYTSCIVTEPVYSINGRRLLLPKGSKVLGQYDMEPKSPRVAVIWDRITTPNGYNVTMKSPGVDGLGGAGHPGRYTAHWGSRIASALLVSLIADAFKYAAAENGPESATIGAGGTVVVQPYESATARSMERLANQALDTRRPATVVINQGTVVNVYVAQDVDFSGVIARL